MLAHRIAFETTIPRHITSKRTHDLVHIHEQHCYKDFAAMQMLKEYKQSNIKDLQIELGLKVENALSEPNSNCVLV